MFFVAFDADMDADVVDVLEVEEDEEDALVRLLLLLLLLLLLVLVFRLRKLYIATTVITFCLHYIVVT